MNNAGTLIVAPIRPQSPEDTYPSAYSSEIKGGCHSVPTLTERNAIPTERRVEGMLCYVINQIKTYQLIGGTGNSSWIPFPISRSDSLSGQINNVTQTTYVLDLRSALIYSLDSISAEVSEGTLTLNIIINSTSVKTLSVTTTTQLSTITSASLQVGDKLSISVTQITGSPNLYFTLGTTPRTY